MERFRKLFWAALVAALITGLGSTVLHQLVTVPMILEAEQYETSAEEHGQPGQPHENVDHDKLPAAASHHHGEESWAPEDGIERTLYTAGADVLSAFAFAALLVAAYSFRGQTVSFRQGLCWGLACFAAFILAPSLGLPAELPGTEAADLQSRQIWWVFTACSTLAGLGLIFLRSGVLAVLVGVFLLVLPHLIGAPQPEQHIALAPQDLIHRFTVAVTWSALVFWLALGAVSAWTYNRFVR